MSQVESDEEDLTRKERREQARSNRRAAEQAEVAAAARRRRLAQLGGAAAVVIIAIVAILIATGGSSKKGGTPVPKSPSVGEVQKAIGGIEQKGNVLGKANAPVTLVYYGDLQCPICKDFTLGALPGVIEKWVKGGKLRIEYRALETATREPETFRNQQTAALAAGAQNKGWYYIELFYHQQQEEASGYVTEAYLQGLAKQVPGLNVAKWLSDRNNNAYANQLETEAQEARSLGFNGTPSFQIGKTGGALKRLESSEYGSLTSTSGFDTAIEKVLKS
jgi:protein-disulfide isomerase